MSKTIRILLCLILFIAGFQAGAQKLRFEEYNESDGISSKFCYAINQEEEGGLLISTNEGVLKYDGTNFNVIASNDSLDNNFARCSFKDSNNMIWFGHNQGGVSYYDGMELNYLPLDTVEVSRINGLTEDSKGNLWVLSQSSGLYKIGANKSVENYFGDLDIYYLYSIEYVQDYFLLGTDMGLISVRIDENDKLSIVEIEGIPMTQVTDIIKYKEQVYLSTKDAGIFSLSFQDNQEILVEDIKVEGLDLLNYKIGSMRIEPNGNLWLSTENYGLIELYDFEGNVYRTMKDYSLCGLEDVKCVNETFVDREGNLWIASLDGGLLRLMDSFFSFYDLSSISNSVYANVIFSNKTNEVWIGSKNELIQASVSPWVAKNIYVIDEDYPNQEVLSTCIDLFGNVWAGSNTGRLYIKKANASKFVLVTLDQNSKGKRINHLLAVENKVFASTGDGVFILENGVKKQKLTLQDGLPDDFVNMALLDSQKRVWFVNKIHGDGENVSFYDLRTEKVIQVFKVSKTKELTSIVNDSKGKIWVGSKGGGLVGYLNDEIEGYSSVNSNLYKNYIYSLAVDGKDQVWAAHRGGLSKVKSKEDIKVYEDFEIENFSFLEHASATDFEGNVWFGTNVGLIRYSPESDLPNKAVPILQFKPIMIDDELVFDYNEEINLPFKSNYKIEFDFLAISLKNSEEVKYQYYLEGYEEEWQEYSYESKEIYNKLGPGNYIFKVRAINGEGIPSNEIKEVRFSIDSPFYYKWWFYLIVGAVAFGIIRWIIIRRERFLKKNQEYLKTKLDERTKEVVEQKEILERTNNDITDSIEYAKKIQTAILPPPNSLNRLFTDAFVFYKPRDIVSGDFYWVAEFEDHVLVACADCTGHGVPGAFMSLIGSALLKEITNHKEIMSPADAMRFLNDEIQLLLNKEDSVFGVSDGMDMTLMEYNKKTNNVRLSSAKRPYVIIKDNEKIVQNGDRFSIGGFLEEDKNFSMVSWELNKGDKVYLYSDGIVDQFGGPRGKKLKHRGFLEMIDEIYNEDMYKQNDMIQKKFKNWINGYDQIDDIIVVGIEI